MARPTAASPQAEPPAARPPRPEIILDVGSGQSRRLPLVIGVLADLTGGSRQRRPAPQGQDFIAIDRDNFDAVLSDSLPLLTLSVPSRLSDPDESLVVELRFGALTDFGPDHLVEQVPQLKQLLAEIDGRERERQARQTQAAQAQMEEAQDAALHDARRAGEAVDSLRRQLADQVREILRHPRFRELEATWRGLHYLVEQAARGPDVKVRVLDVSKAELHQDLSRPPSRQIQRPLFRGLFGGPSPAPGANLEASTLFDRVYRRPFSEPAPEPFGLLVGDFDLDPSSEEDVRLLRSLASLCTRAHVPLIASASQFASRVLSGGAPPVSKEWEQFRRDLSARYVALAAPRVLARPPYATQGWECEAFPFEELVSQGPEEYLWMSGAWAFAARAASAFAAEGWCARAVGPLAGLPTSRLLARAGRGALRTATEIAIPAGRSEQLTDWGLLPLCWHPERTGGTIPDAASCYWAETQSDVAWADLNNLLAVSHLVRALVVLARDLLAAGNGVRTCENRLQEWLARQTSDPDEKSSAVRPRRPLAAGGVELRPVGEPPRHELSLSFEVLVAGGERRTFRAITEVPRLR
jgi:type VI secretion system protein ImpC